MRFLRLTEAIDASDLPDKFRVFRKGENASTKGTVVFDDKAAAEVMANYERHGVDIMIDLAHHSLDPNDPAYNPDAVGWCKLAVIDGELWAADVRWNEDGQERLRTKKQRYISPAFFTKGKRVCSILNIALCAMPATHEALPLVAASRSAEMEELLKRLAAIVGLSEDATEEEITAKLKALAAPPEETEETPPSDPEETEEATALTALTREVSELRSRLEKSEKANESIAVTNLVNANLDKIAPGQEAWARSLSLTALSAYLDKAPAIHKRAAVQPKVDPKLVTLTDTERQAARNLGMTDEAYSKAKAKVAHG